MPEEYVQTGTYTEAIGRIEYDYNGPDTVHCKFCAEMEVVREADMLRSFITYLKLRGWNSRSLSIQGFVLETLDLNNAYLIDIPVMTRVPDEDVPAIYTDERPQ